MKENTFLVKNKLGLHARPAAVFVKVAHRYRCAVQVAKKDQVVDGKSIMGILTLAAEKGSSLLIRAEGPDEEKFMTHIGEMFESRFEEEE